MKKNYILSILSLFIFSAGHSQTTLYTNDFTSTSIFGTSLNDLGFSDYNAISWTTSTLYFFDHTVDGDCDTTTDWTKASTQNSYYGTAPAGMSSYRAGIKSGGSSCSQDQSLITGRWTATESTMTVSFSYSFRSFTSDGFYVYLQSRNGGDFSNHTTLVSTTSSASVDYSSTINVTSGHEYRLVFKYVGTWDYGAAVDTILVRHMPVISGGSDISGLSYATGSGPSTSQSTTVSGLGLAADITLTAPTNFEISTDNSSFSNSLILSESSGTVSSTTIYARLKTGLSAGLYSGNISCTSTNATTVNIALSGGVGVVNLYVDDSGDDDNNTGLTSGSPFATLSKAITTATDDLGVTINVGAGTYTEHTLNLNKSNITITGAGSTTIFANSTSNKHMITISASNSTLEKMTIKDYGFTSGASNAYGGGAIRVGATPGNSTTSTTLSGIVFNDILFKDNTTNATSGDGGAIELTAHSSGSSTTTATINGCTFDGNRAGTNGSSTAGHNGAAVMGKEGCRLTINNSVFFDNTVDYAGTVTIWDSTYDVATVTINNCTFYDNISYSSVAGYIAGGVFAFGGTATINNSIFWDSDATNGDSFDIDGLYSVINMNKSLIEDYSTTNTSGTVTPDSYTSTNEGTTPSFTDVSSDDYSLQSGSVAIDAGSSTYAPADDISDLSRPQGQADDIGAYEHANTWDGSSSSAWATAANWSENIVPVSGRSPVISDVANDPDISTAVTLEGLTLQSGASLDITSTGSLTLTDDFTNNSSTLTISSGGSLIVNGTASGTITYTRTLGSTNWYLVASPVVGETYDDTWVSNNGIASGTGSNRAIATYDTSDNTWDYFQAGSSATFQDGLGYAIKRSSSGTVSFTGTINTDNETETLTTTGSGFNLLGNPYPSYINSGSILSANSSSLDQQTIWLWDQSTDSYDTKVTNDAFKIAPGQGFFVKSDGSGDVSILESYQSHQSDTFQGPIIASPEIYLTLTDDSNTRYTRIKYNENTTTGFDNGYDGEMFGATSNAFAIYTHLVGNEQGQVGNSQGHGYAVQSLPKDNYENMIVPVGINATRGTTINIEATLNNFPEGVNVYLADKQENSVTLLETDTSYSTTLEEDHNGVGRFYIHTTPNALSSGEVMDSIPLSIYTSDSETLTIEGVATGTAYLRLYTMLGEELLRTSFEGTGVNRVLLPYHLNTGIYIVRIATTTGVTSKKIMIN